MSVKSKIQRAEGIPVSQQHLVWQNSELQDHHRLRDYSICPDSTVRLVLGLRGGPLNAPRMPPVRLKPLHFTPVMSQYRPKGIGINRTTFLSRFPFPALGAQRLPTTLGLANSFEKSGKPKGINYPYVELSSNSKEIHDRETPSSSADVVDNPDVDGDRTTKTPNYRLPLIQAPISSTTSAPSLMDGENTATKNYTNENWDGSKTVDHLTNTLGSLLDENNWSSKTATTLVHQSPSLSTVNIASQGSENTGDRGNTDVPTPSASSSVLDYPPLITSNSFRSPLTRFDLPSYWRLYEPREVVVPRVSATLTSLSTAGEHENDGVAAGASGGGHNPTSTIQSSSQPGDESEEGELVSTSTAPVSSSPTAAAAAAANILTSLLSTTTGDTHHLSLPYQRNGTEHSFSGYLSYPFHWLRRSSPLSEGAFFRGPHLLDSRGTPAIVSGDGETSTDHFRASADMDLDSEADNDEEDAEGNSDYGVDEGREGTKVATNLYAVPDEDEVNNGEEEDDEADYDEEDDDDDSLADLEDYLFYYRTGDLLFGPPSSITATCAPYSYYTTLRDSYATDLWRDLLESGREPVGREGGQKLRQAAGEGDANAAGGRVDNSSWHKECKELAEKVNDLKIRMKEVRTRRLNRCNAIQATDTQTQAVEETKTGPPQSELKSSPDDLANSVRDAATNAVTSLTPAKSDREIGPHSTSTATANCFDGRRQRRFGTVTPPELDLLVQPSSQSSRSKQISGTGITASQDAPVSVIDKEALMGAKPLSGKPELRTLSGNVPSASVRGEAFGSKSSDECGSGGTRVVTQPTKTYKSTLLPSPLYRLLPSINDLHPSKTSVSSQLVVETNSGLTKISDRKVAEKSPPSPSKSPNSVRRKRCSLCLRRTGLVNSYSCRCGRNFCSRHRYAELHACPFDYKAEGRRVLLESNPVIASPKLPKI